MNSIKSIYYTINYCIDIMIRTIKYFVCFVIAMLTMDLIVYSLNNINYNVLYNIYKSNYDVMFEALYYSVVSFSLTFTFFSFAYCIYDFITNKNKSMNKDDKLININLKKGNIIIQNTETKTE